MNAYTPGASAGIAYTVSSRPVIMALSDGAQSGVPAVEVPVKSWMLCATPLSWFLNVTSIPEPAVASRLVCRKPVIVAPCGAVTSSRVALAPSESEIAADVEGADVELDAQAARNSAQLHATAARRKVRIAHMPSKIPAISGARRTRDGEDERPERCGC